MKWLRQHHRYVGIIAFGVAIIAYFIQIVYLSTFLIRGQAIGGVIRPKDEMYYTSLLVFLVLEMMVCLGIVGYSAFSIYRAIFDSDQTKEGPDAMFLAFIVSILYLLSGIQYSVYFLIYDQQFDAFTILILTLSSLSILFYILLLFIANRKERKCIILRYILRGLVMILGAVNVISNIIYCAGYDAFTIVTASMELLVPIAVGVLLISEA